MKILFCAATRLEMPPHLIQNQFCEVLIHGPGIAQTAYSLGKYFASNRPEFCIQVGIAGSYDRALVPGDIVLVKQDIFADLGAEERDHTLLHLSTLPFADKTNPFECKFIIPDSGPFTFPYTKVNAITVNTTSGTASTIDKWSRLYSPQIETMEGASFFAACRMENVPCLQIRSISNYVQARDTSAWNIPLALRKLEIATENILTTLLK